MKQLATAAIMYQGDMDDMFPMAFGVNDSERFPFQVVAGRRIITWHHMIMPYAKPDWSMLTDYTYIPTNRPNPLRVDPFIGYGMPPRSAVHQVPFFTDTYYHSSAVRWNGIAGGFPDNPWTPGIRGAPSATSSQIAYSSNTVLLTQATAPDWWLIKYGAGTNQATFNYYTIWPAYGNQTNQTFGPYGRHDMRVQRPAPNRYISLCSGSGSNRTCDAGWYFAIMADSHAKWLDFRGLLAPEQRGTFRVYRYLWPND